MVGAVRVEKQDLKREPSILPRVAADELVAYFCGKDLCTD
jgi:hypothetical protein